MLLNSLLEDAGIPLDDTLLLRHADRKRSVSVFHLSRRDRQAFERYQAMQPPKKFEAYKTARFWVAFASDDQARTVFLGVYKILSVALNTTRLSSEVDDSYVEPETHYVFQTELTPYLSWLRGRLTIDWKGGFRNSAQLARSSPKSVISFGLEITQDANVGELENPSREYNQFTATLVDIDIAPPSLADLVPRLQRSIAVPSQSIDVVSWMVRIERRSQEHETLLQRVASRAVGHDLETSSLLDLLVDRNLMIEIKSLHADATVQARAALAQLYHYRFVYRRAIPEANLLVVFGRRPPSEIIAFLDSCKLGVGWCVDRGFQGTPLAHVDAPWLFDGSATIVAQDDASKVLSSS